MSLCLKVTEFVATIENHPAYETDNLHRTVIFIFFVETREMKQVVCMCICDSYIISKNKVISSIDNSCLIGRYAVSTSFIANKSAQVYFNTL